MINNRFTKFVSKTTIVLLASFILYPVWFYLFKASYYCDNCGVFKSTLFSIGNYFLFFQSVILAPLLVSFLIPFATFNEWRTGKPREWRLTLYIVSWLGLMGLLYLVFH
ncbi:TPA: hypothetical protein DDW69_00745 [candidate division CPR2 bacterium]|nr:MAG: hypothetical protein A2Y27_01625 [candidate division CPR2 bacterium GWD1_39_7]OGB70330.1 MAG: hypothetical protein A2Y26_01125 [candidate division CPR2 bacterium GWD2_39_7]HBG81352.1 hypothetical protein [candidate division CPR2 bacterium]HCL99673.1 hypothetical protein [candidate division CPR2 bacterium]